MAMIGEHDRDNALAYSPQIIARRTEEFLAKITTPANSFIGPLESEVFDITSAMRFATGILGQIKPIILNLPNQRSDQTKDDASLQFIMLVNPESMNHGRTNLVQTNLTRSGFVAQPWGPNQDTLSGTGKTAAFMTTSEGLAMVTSRSSVSYHNILGMMAAYRNNGYILRDRFHGQTLNTGVRDAIDIVSGVEFIYDNDIYSGHFNTFTLDNDAANPFTLSYSFEFICSTLSRDYSQCRGHFIPPGMYEPPTSPLVGDTKVSSNP
jgi:hypothetical protein